MTNISKLCCERCGSSLNLTKSHVPSKWLIEHLPKRYREGVGKKGRLQRLCRDCHDRYTTLERTLIWDKLKEAALDLQRLNKDFLGTKD